MTLQRKRWRIAPAANDADLDRFQDLPPLVAQLLVNRGIQDPATARAFLQDNVAMGSPFLLKDMPKAVERVRKAIRALSRFTVLSV